MTPLVSVLIPAYNCADFIDSSVSSVLSQSLSQFELIVVNDGSTDGTGDRLRAYQDPRMRVITQPNGEVASALNAAIGAAQGTYLAFLDADDIWLPTKLERHIRVHEERPDIDATFSWVDVINRRSEPVRMPCPRWRGTVSFDQLLADFMIRTMSAVVIERRAAVDAGLFRDGYCLDIEFFLRVALLRPDNILAIPEVLTLYRRHAGQRTGDWRRMREGWTEMLGSVRELASDKKAVAALGSSNMHRYFASVAYENGDFHEALRLIRRSFALSPAAFVRDRRNWLMSAAALAGFILPGRLLFALERSAGFDRPESG